MTIGTIKVCTLFSVITTPIVFLFGGWSDVLTYLLILMVADIVTGLIVATFFNKNLKSSKMHKGLLKKAGVLLTVILANILDEIGGTGDLVKTSAIQFFMLMEVISLVENLGLMGVPMPKRLMMVIDVLKEKVQNDEEKVREEIGNS